MTIKTVQYTLQGQIATIRIDDGKRNALSPQVLSEIYQALDKAESDGATVIITGRESVFSAGFDLNVMKRGGINALRMLKAGYALTARVLSYPHPVIAACNGHSLAMGVFLMLSADYVIGSRGDFKIAANEVAIGLTMPRVAAAMLRHRLNPSAYQRAVTLSEYFDVESALSAGLFDEVVNATDLQSRAEDHAEKSTGTRQAGAHGIQTQNSGRADSKNSNQHSARSDRRDAARPARCAAALAHHAPPSPFSLLRDHHRSWKLRVVLPAGWFFRHLVCSRLNLAVDVCYARNKRVFARGRIVPVEIEQFPGIL